MNMEGEVGRIWMEKEALLDRDGRLHVILVSHTSLISHTVT